MQAANSKPWFSVALVACLAGLIIIAFFFWNRKPESPAFDSSSNEIRIPILATSALQTTDPIKSAELVQYNLDLQIFECLVGVGPDGGIVPALAERWEHSADFKVWTFFLRDARFSEDQCFGKDKTRKITVDDVIFSWKRGLSPRLGSLNSWALSTCVVGADAFAKGEKEDIAGLRKIDDHTLTVDLTTPDRDFLTHLVVLSTAIVAPEAVEHYAEQFGAHPVGTGPFRLREWVTGEYVLLERNPSYGKGNGWQPHSPNVDRVRFLFFRSESQIAKAYALDSLDMRDVFGSDLAQLKDISSVEQLKSLYPDANVVRPGGVCSLHLLAPLIGPDYPFGESAILRRSLAASFDHQQLIASAVGPLGTMTKTLMLPQGILVDSLPASKEPSAAESPDASAETMLQGKAVKVAYVSSRTADITIEILRKWIEQRGGSLRLFPSSSINALFASVGGVKPDLTLIYWSPYYPNVANFVTALLSSSRPVPNFTGFSNRQLDDLAQRLKTASDADALQVRAEIKTLLDREMPWIPLYFETPLLLVKHRVRDFKISPVSVMVLTDVKLDWDGPTKEHTR